MMRLRRLVRPSMAAASINAVSRKVQIWASGRMGEMGPRTRWSENLGAGKRIPLRWLHRAGFEPCVRGCIAQDRIVLRPLQTRRGGTSTERLNNAAGQFSLL